MKSAVLLAALLVSALVRETEAGALSEAVLWLPSGIAVAGVWWLGPWFLVAVAVASVAIRIQLEYPIGVVVSGAAGSVAEGIAGAWLLRRLGVRPAFARLRDVLGLFAVAAAAPLASMACSWFGRVVLGVFGALPFYSGWGGWWRMNALGLLVVVPLIGTCRERAYSRQRGGIGPAFALGSVLAAVLLWVIVWIDPGFVGVMALQLTLLLALFAALSFGPRGAVVTAAISAIAIALGTAHGLGPFQTVDLDERHGALQLFELTLISVPLVLGALIAEREVAIESRVRSERDMQALQEILPDVTYRIRGDGTVVAMVVPVGSHAVFRPQEIVGRNVVDVVPREIAERSLANVQATLRGEPAVPYEHQLVVDGVVRQREARYVRLSADEVLCVVRDNTERRRLEDELRHAQKMEAIGRLAGGIAHDFNNVLTVIAGSAEALLETLPKGDPAREDATMIAEAAERATRVTRQMLAFSRRQVLSPQVVDLAVVVDGLASLLRRAIGESIELVVERGAEPATVRVDRGQMEQVVMNLVLNARDALPRGGRVRITTRVDELERAFVAARGGSGAGRHVCIEVADNGVGMDAATRAHAFEPFFTTKEPGQGTGLGLATVWGVVRQSGGFADITSELGRGTTVSVWLPAVTDVAPAPPREAAAEAPPRPATVLVAEDDDAVRELLVRALRAANHTVLAAADGEEAEALAASSAAPIDLLVSDVIMPRRDGRELAIRLRRTNPGLRVLFVSGYTNRAFESDGLPPGTAFLEKPFSRETLLARVREMLLTTTA